MCTPRNKSWLRLWPIRILVVNAIVVRYALIFERCFNAIYLRLPSSRTTTLNEGNLPSVPVVIFIAFSQPPPLHACAVPRPYLRDIFIRFAGRKPSPAAAMQLASLQHLEADTTAKCQSEVVKCVLHSPGGVLVLQAAVRDVSLVYQCCPVQEKNSVRDCSVSYAM